KTEIVIKAPNFRASLAVEARISILVTAGSGLESAGLPSHGGALLTSGSQRAQSTDASELVYRPARPGDMMNRHPLDPEGLYEMFVAVDPTAQKDEIVVGKVEWEIDNKPPKYVLSRM
ncbi:hypothetical protein FOZ63_009564, partial [Perkinsus olseni]